MSERGRVARVRRADSLLKHFDSLSVGLARERRGPYFHALQMRPERPPSKQQLSFDVSKKNALAKFDKSPKGSLDAPIAPHRLEPLPHLLALLGNQGRLLPEHC